MGAGFGIDGIYASGIKIIAIKRTEPFRDIVFMFRFGEPGRQRHTAISALKSATTSAQSH
jgi:hypothetical protein